MKQSQRKKTGERRQNQHRPHQSCSPAALLVQQRWHLSHVYGTTQQHKINRSRPKACLYPPPKREEKKSKQKKRFLRKIKFLHVELGDHSRLNGRLDKWISGLSNFYVLRAPICKCLFRCFFQVHADWIYYSLDVFFLYWIWIDLWVCLIYYNFHQLWALGAAPGNTRPIIISSDKGFKRLRWFLVAAIQSEL